MANFNKVILCGNLCRDVELRYTPNGKAVSDNSIGVNEKFGETENTIFVNLTFWGRQAEILSEYCGKGSSLLIDGRLSIEKWQDKDGNNRQNMKVVVNNFQMLGSKNSRPQAAVPNTSQSSEALPTTEVEPEVDGEIPF
jgi:single-strand DNA-binding protein